MAWGSDAISKAAGVIGILLTDADLTGARNTIPEILKGASSLRDVMVGSKEEAIIVRKALRLHYEESSATIRVVGQK